jgi:hypothetical protein
MTLRKLAQEIGCDHKMFAKWRAKYPDAPPENEPAPWKLFLKLMGLHANSGRMNAPLGKETAAPAEPGAQPESPTPKRKNPLAEEYELRLEERRLRVEREKLELRMAKDQMVPIAHIEAALGAMLAKFRQGLDALIGRIAGGIDEADKDELVKLLKRAEAEG